MFSKKIIYFVFLLFLFIGYIEAFPPRILIKLPTRDRYDQFFSALDNYYRKLSHQVPYHFLISCDSDDQVMNSERTIKRLKTYPHLSYYFSNNSSKIAACNNDIEKHLDFDILILASDDMMPIAQNFDLIIARYMQYFYPTYDGILHFNDGFQGVYLNTLPIIGKKFYDRFGYIYYPGYKSFYCDAEMTEVSRMLNKTVYVDQVIIEHCHPAIGKGKNDSLYERNNLYVLEDYDLYLKRRAINFGIPFSEIIIPLPN
jgi:hypothetical protein